MAETEAQSLENHARVVPLFHVGVVGAFLVNLVWALYDLWRLPGAETVVRLFVALGLLGLTWYARIFALTVQDRVIRLEMRLRLRDVLPADMHARIGELTRGQLVALRFASDAELPGLVREIQAGTLRDRAEIKSRIRDWQADHLRA